jgi:F-type H+-transporting ATPase subunit gamma
VANLKEIKRRIGSVKKTKQITSAMKLVSGAKLARATQAATAAQPYQSQLSAVLGRVAMSAGDGASNPLLESRDEIKSVLIATITTDRGLCGGFNTNLMKRVRIRAKELEAQGISVTIVDFGRKGRDFAKSRSMTVAEAIVDYGRTPKMDLVRPLAEKAETGFIDGTYDQVLVAYNRFINTIMQVPGIEQVLPLSLAADDDAPVSDDPVDMEYEPSTERLLSSLLPLYLRTLLLQAFLETEAGEYAARMTAMDNATRNASDLIDELSLEYNRARQAAITTEITEIVSGAEALNG